METNNSQLVIYQTPQGDTRIDVRVKGETIWLTQRQIADLFGTKVPAISKHLKNIFATGELQEDVGQAEIPVHLLNWSKWNVKILGV